MPGRSEANLQFEWDPEKAKLNLAIHGVSFEEAATVFADGLSRTIFDPLHSVHDERFVLIRLLQPARLLILVLLDLTSRFALSVLDARRDMSDELTKKVHPEDLDILVEYDFAGGIQGKYAERYAAGTNLVRLDPDVRNVFPDSESVNHALRAMAQIIEKHEKTVRRRIGGRRGRSTE